MKKRMIALLLGTLLVLSCTIPVLADTHNGLYILDEKEYLQETVWEAYQIQAKTLSDQLNIDILYVQTYETDLKNDAQTMNMGTRPDQIMLVDNDGTCDIVLFGAACALTEEHIQQLRHAYIVKPTYTEGVAAYLEMAEQVVTGLNEAGKLDLNDDPSQLSSRLEDQASLMSAEEKDSLLARLDEISQRLQMDVLVVMVDSLNGQTAQDYAAARYESSEYGIGTERDGVLLLVNAEDCSWYLHTSGFAATVFAEEARTYLAEQVDPQLNEGAYAAGLQTFADMCVDFVTRAQTPATTGVDSLPKQRFAFGKNLLISLGIGAIVACAVVFYMMRQLKSGKVETVESVEPKLTVNKDLLLYSSTTSRQKRKSGGGATKGSESDC